MNDPRMSQLYENTRYNFERNTRKTITIHSSGGTISKEHNLQEPLTIDAFSEVYIDSFLSNNGRTTSAVAPVFILGVEEFNIQSVSNESKYNNKIIIPNTTGTAAPGTTVTHRATKFNYVGAINPCTLTKLTISLTDNGPTDDSAAPGKAGEGASTNFWITFMIVAKE